MSGGFAYLKAILGPSLSSSNHLYSVFYPLPLLNFSCPTAVHQLHQLPMASLFNTNAEELGVHRALKRNFQPPEPNSIVGK